MKKLPSLAHGCRCLFGRLLTAAAVPVAAFAHEFTLPNGGKLNGDIAGVTADQVVVQGADRRQFTVPLAVLPPADREHFYQWCKANQKFRLHIATEPKIAGGQRKDSGLRNGSGQKLDGYMQDWTYRVTVRNLSAFSHPELSMEVQTYIDESGSAPPAAYKTPQVVALPAMKSGAVHTFETAAIPLATFRPPKGAVFTKGNNMEHKNRLGGMSAIVKMNDGPIWLHETHPGLLSMKQGAGNQVLQIQPSRSGSPYSGTPEGLAQHIMGNLKGDAKIRFGTPLK